MALLIAAIEPIPPTLIVLSPAVSTTYWVAVNVSAPVWARLPQIAI